MRAFLFILVIFFASCVERGQNNIAIDTLSRTIDIQDTTVIPVIDRDNSWSPFHPKYSFEAFPANLYKGKLAGPNYSSVDYGQEKDFKEFMTERLEGMSVNFGGKYTIVEKSCGAMCSAIYIVDRKTGKILSFPHADGHWGYKYYPNSNLLLANASLVNDSLTKYLDQWSIIPEFYEWTGTRFTLLP